MVGLLHHPVASRRCASPENEQAAASLRKAATQLFVDQAFIFVACARGAVLFAMSTNAFAVLQSGGSSQCCFTVLKIATA